MYDLSVSRLSLGCLYILLGRGRVDFPNSDKAHPSLVVTVNVGVGGFIRSGDSNCFPFFVNWEIWQMVVVPVLKNPPNEVWTNVEPYLKNYQNWQTISLGDFDTMLSIIGAALTRGLKREGFLPKEQGVDYSETFEEPPIEEVPVETWPDGRIKLVYPTVE